MDSPDILGLIAARCDPMTAMALLAINRAAYAALWIQMPRMRYVLARERIKQHVAELPSRISECSGPPNSITHYTVMRPGCLLQAQARVYNGGTVANMHVFVASPLGTRHAYSIFTYILSTRSTMYFEWEKGAIEFEYGGIAVLNESQSQLARKLYGSWANRFRRLAYKLVGRLL